MVPGSNSRDCCPLNFTGKALSFVKGKDILDLPRITENLMRLNLAFCMITGDREMSGRRFDLKNIPGDFPLHFNH
jgi:hypothetical protein